MTNNPDLLAFSSVVYSHVCHGSISLLQEIVTQRPRLPSHISTGGHVLAAVSPLVPSSHSEQFSQQAYIIQFFLDLTVCTCAESIFGLKTYFG